MIVTYIPNALCSCGCGMILRAVTVGNDLGPSRLECSECHRHFKLPTMELEPIPSNAPPRLIWAPPGHEAAAAQLLKDAQ